MVHFTYRGVNEAFQNLVGVFRYGQDQLAGTNPEGRYCYPPNAHGIQFTKSASRVGDVLVIQEPMTITYTHPRERVLFNEARDANPLFHMFESLWMLAGRNDIAPLQTYSSKIADFCSDDGLTANGSYGRRWRSANPQSRLVETGIGMLPDLQYTDQLKIIIDQLKRKPESRRAVLQMWNVEDDLLKIDNSRDVCCNLSVLFAIRKVCDQLPDFHDKSDGYYTSYLDMTVTNRSNDLILGMLGANVVHFSFLQEYLAYAIGVEVGVYNQFSNNLHVYTEANGGFHPDKWLKGTQHPSEQAEGEQFTGYARSIEDQTVNGGVLTGCLLTHPNIEVLDEEIRQFIDDPYKDWSTSFLRAVARPMCEAFKHHKARQYDLAREACKRIRAEDWQLACTTWIAKRERMYLAKAKETE